MERRTFLGTCAAMLGLPRLTEPVRPIRSKPYIKMGRPEYEEPDGYLCVQHGGSPACEQMNATNGLKCPRCDESERTIDNETFRIIIGDDGFAHLVGPRQDQEWARLGLQNGVTRIKGPTGRYLRESK